MALHVRRLPSRLDLYITVITAIGLGVIGDLLLRVELSGVHRPSSVVLALLVCMVVSESQPLVISRGDDVTDEVTTSSTFILALAVLGPIWLLIAVQVLSSGFDDVRRGKGLRRFAFNIAQAVISAAATRAVYCALTGRAYLGDDRTFGLLDVAPALFAGIVFFLLNNGLTGTVVALWLKTPVLAHLRADIRLQLSTSGVLLSFTPVVIVACQFGLWLLPLMLLPIIAVHQSARLAAERERQAMHDDLTDLPNRVLLQERTAKVLLEAERTGTLTAVLLIDLDHFKDINDTLGHYVGDQLLREVAHRLRSSLREGDSVARLGGDEYAVLATELLDREGAEEVARRVVASLAQPFTIDGVRLDVQASVGIAVAPEHGDDVATLMQRADVALYAAKEHRGCFALYSPEGDLHSVEKLALLGQLREGVATGQLRVHYQPKCDATTGRLLGMEALVRWQHPTRGLLYPDEFIDMAENTGLIGALTLEVLDRSLQTARRLADEGHVIGLAVNLSVRLLTDLELPLTVAALLDRWGVPPQQLTLEVTETSIMVDPTRTMTVLGMLRDIGISLSIDDYGTGYSSLAYLKKLQAHEIKIDKSFVHSMATNSNDAVIVRSTIELGHNLGLRVVAEGVEDDATWALLASLRCDVVQGFRLSRPIAPEHLSGWIAAYGDGARGALAAAAPGRTLSP